MHCPVEVIELSDPSLCRFGCAEGTVGDQPACVPVADPVALTMWFCPCMIPPEWLVN